MMLIADIIGIKWIVQGIKLPFKIIHACFGLYLEIFCYSHKQIEIWLYESED